MTHILDWDVRMAKNGLGPVLFDSSAAEQIISLKEFPNLKGIYLAVRTANEPSTVSFSVSIKFGEGEDGIKFRYSKESHRKSGAQTFEDWTIIPLDRLGIKTPNEVRIWLKHSIAVKSFRAIA